MEEAGKREDGASGEESPWLRPCRGGPSMAWLVAFQSSRYPTWVCPRELGQQPVSPCVAGIKDCGLRQTRSPACVTATFWLLCFLLLLLLLLLLKGTIRKGNKAAEMQASMFVSNALGRIRPACLTPAA